MNECIGNRLKISLQHYDSKYWLNPEEFDPLRFTKEKVAERHPMAYMPFGHGPRHCIGNVTSFQLLYFVAVVLKSKSSLAYVWLLLQGIGSP